MLERNRWFQRRSAAAITRFGASWPEHLVVFAHSYSAREVFRVAKSRGWTTLLGQIDPGEVHFDIVGRAYEGLSDYGTGPVRPPEEYFEQWRQECALADWIVVNSEWSRECLERAGIPGRKLRVVPLAYEAERVGAAFRREYPETFTPARPLRILFVGHASVPKGLHLLLEAVSLLGDVPWRLRVAGLSGTSVQPRPAAHGAIDWLGSIPRSEVMRQYREADVLVFPSLSDGFGMVQVEAQGWALPVIASRFCGAVVRDGVNGIVLSDLSAESLANAIGRVGANPGLLAEFSSNARSGDYGLDALGERLLQIAGQRGA